MNLKSLVDKLSLMGSDIQTLGQANMVNIYELAVKAINAEPISRLIRVQITESVNLPPKVTHFEPSQEILDKLDQAMHVQAKVLRDPNFRGHTQVDKDNILLLARAIGLVADVVEYQKALTYCEEMELQGKQLLDSLHLTPAARKQCNPFWDLFHGWLKVRSNYRPSEVAEEFKNIQEDSRKRTSKKSQYDTWIALTALSMAQAIHVSYYRWF